MGAAVGFPPPLPVVCARRARSGALAGESHHLLVEVHGPQRPLWLPPWSPPAPYPPHTGQPRPPFKGAYSFFAFMAACPSDLGLPWAALLRRFRNVHARGSLAPSAERPSCSRKAD